MPRSTMSLKSGSSMSAEKFLSQVDHPKASRAPLDNELPGLGQFVSLSIDSLASTPCQQTEERIGSLLQEILDCCRFDWCGLMTLTPDKTAFQAVFAVGREGLEVASHAWVCGLDELPWTGENLLRGDIVCFASLDELPPGPDRRYYKSRGVQASLAVPIYVDGLVEYFIVAHFARATHCWSKESISQLRLIGEIFVNALLHGTDKRASRPSFEQLMAELSVTFINVTPEEVDGEIDAALDQLRRFFRFDRLGLLTFSDDKREVSVSYLSCAEGIAPLPERENVCSLFPWTCENLLKGETVSFSSLDDLPEEGAIDRASWQRAGTKSHLNIPIRVGGSCEHFVAASHVLAPHPFDAEVITRLRLLGEIFANALIRCKAEAAQQEKSVEIQRLMEKLQVEFECLPSEERFPARLEEIIGQSVPIAKMIALVEQVAPTDSTVLICGETGTGKELVAGAIHKLSMRRNKPMVKVNCASLPSALVESELFGREKGAYTGALTRQAGRFELADGGTIFLDEIAEMSLELQAKLLRVLQEGQFERLGSTKTLEVDVRVIAATNRNLPEEVKKGRFREDLYYRLNVFQITAPPLRERSGDIPLLVWAFVDELGKKMGKKITKISKQDMADLQAFPWPGNVRELRNVIEHAVIVSTGERLQVRLPENASGQGTRILTLEESEARHIREALRMTGWRIKGEGGAARLLGMNPSTLYSRMQKLGISNRPLKDEMSP
ncbi:sigma-54-dependent Fis family transcriptional regulator [Geomonas sp.]|uniref:sigma-54-dependent Fis family transcriptional regulator n=1 Tax=Geomonas sp. TaxID=2651584 RepID=UPI002B4745B1|nr:sigma 54-interacting transcriptional regulator [Geomonas sp.]HJV35414.1 sigma 54-interacting transcriptional regulator [Geomonas sp.]